MQEGPRLWDGLAEEATVLETWRKRKGQCRWAELGWSPCIRAPCCSDLQPWTCWLKTAYIYHPAALGAGVRHGPPWVTTKLAAAPHSLWGLQDRTRPGLFQPLEEPTQWGSLLTLLPSSRLIIVLLLIRTLVMTSGPPQ